MEAQRLVYILSTCDEDGTENVRATMDKSRLAGMLEALQKELLNGKAPDEHETVSCLQEKEQLMNVLARNVPGRDGYDLSERWGGIELHIIPLGGD